jgi:hypothetical protein
LNSALHFMLEHGCGPEQDAPPPEPPPSVPAYETVGNTQERTSVIQITFIREYDAQKGSDKTIKYSRRMTSFNFEVIIVIICAPQIGQPMWRLSHVDLVL